MAILKHGINGPFSGRVGNIVGYELNGQNVIRSLPSRNKQKPTDLTLINRGRMTAVSKFLRPLKRVIAFGYKDIAPAGSRIGAFQAAQSHTLKHAIAYGEGNVPYVDPCKVLVFRGDWQAPRGVEAVRTERGIRLSWDVTGQLYTDAVVLILAYDPGSSFVRFEDGVAKVSQGVFDWDLGQHILDTFEGLHIYAGFYHIARDERSDSVYAGCV